jgi:hypothetical protein
MNAANRNVVSNINIELPYNNHAFFVEIKGDANIYAHADVERTENKMHGEMWISNGQTPVQKKEFYISIDENNAIVRLKDGGEWFETVVSSGIFKNYEIENIIETLLSSEFESFPRRSDYFSWSILPKNSFIESIDLYSDKRISRIEASLPSNAAMYSLFFVVADQPSDIDIVYGEKGSCGKITINEPDWNEINVQRVDDFSMIFDRDLINLRE